MFVDPQAGMAWLLAVPLLSFAAFWCTCAVTGTVRAALWVFPVMIALYLTREFGERIGSGLINLLVLKFDPFANFKFTYALVSSFQHSLFFSFVSDYSNRRMPTVLWVPTLLLAVIQSYRLFRAQVGDSTLAMVRNLLPLTMMAFLCSFSLAAYLTFAGRALGQTWEVFDETFRAIEKVQPGANLDAAHPLLLTVEDLAEASPLSEHTRRWLRHSLVTIAPLKGLPGQDCCEGTSWSSLNTPDNAYSWSVATINFTGASGCTRSFQRRIQDLHMLLVVCK